MATCENRSKIGHFRAPTRSLRPKISGRMMGRPPTNNFYIVRPMNAPTSTLPLAVFTQINFDADFL